MSNADLQAWLARDDVELVATVKSDVREHVATLNDGGDPFYGYAILPGESYSVDNLIAAFSRQSDLSARNASELYYRYSVDEWANYERDAFRKSNDLIRDRNLSFSSLHVKDDSNAFIMDDFQIAHVAKLHEAIITALAELRRDRVFGGEDKFVIVWIPDSGHHLVYRSAKALNSASVYETFMSEFGV